MKEKNYHQFQILKCFAQTDKASALTADITLLSGLTFLRSTEYNVLPASVKLYLIFNMTFSIWVTGNQPVCFRHANANVHFCRTQNQHFHRTQTQHSHSSWTQHSHSTWTQHSNSSWTHWYLHFCSTWTQHFHSMRILRVMSAEVWPCLQAPRIFCHATWWRRIHSGAGGSFQWGCCWRVCKHTIHSRPAGYSLLRFLLTRDHVCFSHVVAMMTTACGTSLSCSMSTTLPCWATELSTNSHGGNMCTTKRTWQKKNKIKILKGSDVCKVMINALIKANKHNHIWTQRGHIINCKIYCLGLLHFFKCNCSFKMTVKYMDESFIQNAKHTLHYFIVIFNSAECSWQEVAKYARQ